MSANVFYRKWRPQSLAEVVGQEHITQTLLNALSTGRLTHAYVFCGPKGTGKTSTGRILAKALNCETNEGHSEPCNKCLTCQSIAGGHCLDVIEIDAASNRGVDEIRSLCEKVNYAPNSGRYKVYIIDEFHMLTTEASNALLKTLEEPPSHVIFILATTEAHKILPTILSRCQRYDFRKVSLEATVAQLQKIADGEGIDCPKEALTAIARAAGGSLRDAENLLQQLFTHYGECITLENAKEMLGSASSDYSLHIIETVLQKDGGGALLAINEANNHGASPKTLLKDILGALRLALLAKNNCLQSAELTKDEIARFNRMVQETSLTHILKTIRLFATADNSAENGFLPIEVAAAEAALFSEESPKPTSSAGIAAKSAVVHNKESVPTTTPKNAEECTASVKCTSDTKPPAAYAPKAVHGQSAGGEEVFDFANMPVFEKTTPEVPRNLKQTAENNMQFKVAAAENMESPSVAANIINHPSDTASADIGSLREKLKEFCKNAPVNLRTSVACAILRSPGIVELESVQNDAVMLAFKHKFHMEKLSKDPTTKKDAEEIIAQALGQKYSVQCRLEESDYLVKEALKMGAKMIKEEND